MMMSSLPQPDLSSLTPQQRVAVEHVDGPLLILAGPGSGKTRVVTYRVAHLLAQGVPAEQIVALTFTNKAADEMRSRVERLAPGARVWLGTFHRFCSRLLRRYASLVGLSENFTIYDTPDSLKALKQAIAAADVELIRYQPEQVRSHISWLKNHLTRVGDFAPRPGHPLDSLVARIFPLYQKKLLSSSAVDFDDLLLHVAHLLRDNPEVRRDLDARFRYVLVDEYQDTNLVQYAIARGLSIDYPNLAVTGDPDQSIFGWRGANLGNILEFERDFPGARVVRLERNYRSTKAILRVADALIANNQQRKAKRLHTENDEGAPVSLFGYATQRDEAEGIAGRIARDVAERGRRPRDFAIFYRVNALSRSLEHALREHGIPYQLVRGVEFFQRQEIKEVMAYLHLLNNPRDDVALTRIINVPPRGIGAATVERLGKHAAARGTSLLEAARLSGTVEAIAKRAAARVAGFVALIDRLGLSVAAPLEELVGLVLSGSGYREMFADSELEEDQQRLANVEELLTVARDFDRRHPEDGSLEAFLEETALVNDTDDWADETDKVTLMSLHSAKGLEFPIVFIVAVEDGLLPHERSRDEPDKLEEERRLLFVGITRAREELKLSYARLRDFRGLERLTVPSRFLVELPRDEMEVVTPGLSYDDFAGPLSVDNPSDGYAPADHSLTDHALTNDGHAETEEDFSSDDEAHAADGTSDRAAPVAGLLAGASPAGAATCGAATALTTAAELAEADAASPRAGGPRQQPPVSPEVFCLGMLVSHPHYGLGKIAALSGSGAKRTATINFASTAGQKKFLLSASPLRPARG